MVQLTFSLFGDPIYEVLLVHSCNSKTNEGLLYLFFSHSGLEGGVGVGQTRIFMSHGGCRDGLDLKQGSQYLIIGPKDDQWNVDTETNK